MSTELETGKRYKVFYKRSGQAKRKEHFFFGVYVGVGGWMGESFLFDMRPQAGTQEVYKGNFVRAEAMRDDKTGDNRPVPDGR